MPIEAGREEAAAAIDNGDGADDNPNADAREDLLDDSASDRDGRSGLEGDAGEAFWQATIVGVIHVGARIRAPIAVHEVHEIMTRHAQDAASKVSLWTRCMVTPFWQPH